MTLEKCLWCGEEVIPRPREFKAIVISGEKYLLHRNGTCDLQSKLGYVEKVGAMRREGVSLTVYKQKHAFKMKISVVWEKMRELGTKTLVPPASCIAMVVPMFLKGGIGCGILASSFIFAAIAVVWREKRKK